MMQKHEMQTLEGRLQKLTRAQGSPSRVNVAIVSDIPTLRASINHSTKDINFSVPYEWDITRYDAIKKFAEKAKISAPEEKTCSDVNLHEIGHHKLRNDMQGLGCPQDMDGKEMAVDAVTKALLEEGKYSMQGALYLENCIADIIDNTNGSRFTKFNGLSMFLAEQGELNKEKYSKLYEAFVKLNMQLWGGRRQKQLLSRYYTNDAEVDQAVQSCMNDLNLRTDKKENLRILFNRDEWQSTFYTFAKHLAKFMEQDVPEFLPGSGSSGKGYKVPMHFDDAPAFDTDKVDDPMMRKLLDPDTLKRVMLRRSRQGESLPSFVENWKALDYFYQGLASEIIIKAESPKKGESMPIAPIQARQYDSDHDRVEDILFGRILLDESGKPCFAVPRDHVQYVARFKKSIKSYPELNIAVLDNSISMCDPANSRGVGQQNIVPWGDNSKYHYALLSYYGVEKALHAMGVGTKTRYALVTFSNRTEATGELTYEDKTIMKQRMLDPSFGNSTSIDVGVLARSAREPGSILMTISDGDIQNWDSIKNDVKRIISDKYYVHFQIGPDTQATRDLVAWGASVIKVNDASELPKRAIDLSQKFYKSYAAGEQR